MADEHDFFGEIFGSDAPEGDTPKAPEQKQEQISRFTKDIKAHVALEGNRNLAHTEAAFSSFSFRFSDPKTHNLVTHDELLVEDREAKPTTPAPRAASVVQKVAVSTRDEQVTRSHRRLDLLERPIDEPEAKELPPSNSGSIFEKAKKKQEKAGQSSLVKRGMAEVKVQMKPKSPEHKDNSVARKASNPWQVALDKIDRI